MRLNVKEVRFRSMLLRVAGPRPRLISVAEDAVLQRQAAEDGALAEDMFTRPASTTASY